MALATLAFWNTFECLLNMVSATTPRWLSAFTASCSTAHHLSPLFIFVY